MTIQNFASFEAETAQTSATSKLVKAWEAKNAKRAVKASGATLMALSLSACGSEDNTPFAQTDIDSAVAAANAAAATAQAAAVAAEAAKVTAAEAAQAAAEATATAATAAKVAAEADAATAQAAQAAAETAQAAAEADAATAATAQAAAEAAQATAEAAVVVAEAAQATAEAALAAQTTAITDAGFADVDALIAAYAALVAPVAEAMTTKTTDIVSGTVGDDTFTAVVGATGSTFQAGDLVTDASAADNDTLTITATTGIANGADARVVGIENIVINYTGFANAEFDLDDVAASSYTLNNMQIAGSTGGTFTDVNSGSTVTGGSNVTGTFVVNAEQAAASVSVVSGSDITVTQAAGGTATAFTANVTSSKVGTSADKTAIVAEGSSKSTDVLNLSVSGEATLDSDGATADQIETLNISGNGAAATVAIVGAPTAINTSGDYDVTVTGAAALFTGKAVVGTSSGVDAVKITTAGALDTTKMSVDKIVTGDNSGNAFTVASGQNVQATATQTTDFEFTAAAASKTTNVINIDINDDAAAVNTIDLVATKATNIAEINVTATDNIDFGAVTITSAGTLNISGAGTAVVAGSSTAKAVNASGMTGSLTATLGSNLTTVTGGAGKDNISIASDHNFTIDGGAGQDTLTIVSASTDIDFSDNTTASLSNIEVIVFDDTTNETTHTFASSAVNNAVLIVKGEGSTTNMDHFGVDMDETSVNLSGITIDASMDDIVVTSTSVASSALEITGSAYADKVTTGSQSDVINLGEGANTVVDSGDGDDTITGGSGVDTVTQSGAGNDTLSLGDGNNVVTDTGAGNDVITTGKGDDTVTTSGAGNDVMNLGDGTNTADGNSGDDNITGGTGVDTFTGGAGKDVLTGLAGADVLYGDNAGTKEVATLTLVGSNAGALAAGDDFTATIMGKAITVADGTDYDVSSSDDIDDAAAALIAAINTALGDVILATAGASADDIVITSLVDGNLTNFAVAGVDGSAGAISQTLTLTQGGLSAGGVDTIDAGEGADLVFGGEGKDVINLGSDTDADVIITVAAMGGDTITNFASGTGADTIKFAADLFNNGTEVATLKSIASNGVIADNDAFVEITTATAAGGADTAAEVAAHLVNMDTSNMGNSESVLLAVNDGADTYLWKYTEAATATNDVQEAELTLEATLVGVTDIANGDLAFIA